MEKQSIRGKRRARKLALQALYQWLMSENDVYAIEAQFHATNDMSKVDADYFHRLLHGVPAQLNALEEKLKPFLDRPVQSLNPVERSVLRLCAFELLHCPEIPYRVLLDEAVSLTKLFGSQEGHRYVNGVLNNLAKQVRTLEIRDEHE